MKRGMLASVFSLVGFLAAPAGAQVMAPGQMPPAVPPPDAYGEQAPNGYDPNLVDPQMIESGEQAAYGQPDLGPDNEIAQTYDDGYDPQAYTEFQDALAPYGTWENDESYGEVWTPAAAVVGANFVPYGSGGHWIRSEYGWTWVSDWNWGWAPFHYGRWAIRAGHWSWVPGTMWGPSWVAWRSGGGYVGWAPLPPRGVRLASWTRTGSPWCFTQASSLGAPRLQFLAPRLTPRLFAQTTVLSSDRLLTHGGYRVHINAGPIRAAYAPEVPLARVAPTALPRQAVYPHPGMPIYSRPWVRGPEAKHDPLTNGWHAGMPVSSSRGSFSRPAPAGGGATFGRPGAPSSMGVSRPGPAFNAPVTGHPASSFNTPVYGRPSPSFAGRPSAGANLSLAPQHPAYQPPAPRPTMQPAHPTFQSQPQSAHAFAPAPHAFTPPPPSNGGFRGAPTGGGGNFHPQAGGGFHPAPAGGGFQAQGGGFHPAPAGGGFHPAPAPAGGGFQGQGGGVRAPMGGGGASHFGGGPAGHRR